MMTRFLTRAAMALTAAGLAASAPAAALSDYDALASMAVAQDHSGVEYGSRHKRDGRRGNSFYGERSHNDDDWRDRDRIDRHTRVWQGNDGRYYCRKSDGTTGLLIGAGAGGLLGHEIAGDNGDRTLGAILGAAGGALLGREIDRSGNRCR